MLKTFIIASLSTLMISTTVQANPFNNLLGGSNVIYGKDNRIEITQASKKIQEFAKSVAIQVPTRKIKKLEENSNAIISQTLGLGFNLCPKERFFKQATPGTCTGFLVAPDILVTAGHCMTSARDCSDLSWVFNYNINNQIVSDDEIYKCSSVINQVNNRTNRSTHDYAIIRLDRKVVGASPLKYRKKGKVRFGQKLFLIGHPMGIPAKFTDKARVQSFLKINFALGGPLGLEKHPLMKKKKDIFLANFDSYSGNSGSPVFNAKTGLVEGILIEGEDDFTFDFDNGCMRSNRLSNRPFYQSERVQRITVLPLSNYN